MFLHKFEEFDALCCVATDVDDGAEWGLATFVMTFVVTFDAIAVAVDGDDDKEELSEESWVKTSAEKIGKKSIFYFFSRNLWKKKFGYFPNQTKFPKKVLSIIFRV